MFIFLDDERFPSNTGAFANAKIVRTYAEFCELIDQSTLIEGISFDHDLGEEQSGLDCAKYLIDADMDRNVLAPDPRISVHSMNPVGAKNIEMLLASYLYQR